MNGKRDSTHFSKVGFRFTPAYRTTNDATVPPLAFLFSSCSLNDDATFTTVHRFLLPTSDQNSESVSLLWKLQTWDLLKWCKRISGLGFQFMGDSLSTYVAECIYKEAVDVLATSSSSVEMRLRIMRELADIWGIPISSADTLFPVDKPVVKDLRSDIIDIGRVTIQRIRKPTSAGKKPFVEIRTSLHILERVAGSVK